jgi:hypothetical protein
LKVVIGIVVLVAMLAPLIAVASFRRKGSIGLAEKKDKASDDD